jgi:hypothetical protein
MPCGVYKHRPLKNTKRLHRVVWSVGANLREQVETDWKLLSYQSSTLANTSISRCQAPVKITVGSPRMLTESRNPQSQFYYTTFLL